MFLMIHKHLSGTYSGVRSRATGGLCLDIWGYWTIHMTALLRKRTTMEGRNIAVELSSALLEVK